MVVGSCALAVGADNPKSADIPYYPIISFLRNDFLFLIKQELNELTILLHLRAESLGIVAVYLRTSVCHLNFCGTPEPIIGIRCTAVAQQVSDPVITIITRLPDIACHRIWVIANCRRLFFSFSIIRSNPYILLVLNITTTFITATSGRTIVVEHLLQLLINVTVCNILPPTEPVRKIFCLAVRHKRSRTPPHVEFLGDAPLRS